MLSVAEVHKTLSEFYPVPIQKWNEERNIKKNKQTQKQKGEIGSVSDSN